MIGHHFSVSAFTRAERLRRLLVTGKNLHSEIDETGLHHLIGQCLHDRRIELADDVVRRALGRGLLDTRAFFRSC